MKKFSVLILLLALFLLSYSGFKFFKVTKISSNCEVVGQDLHLGKVHFPTSTTSPEAQAHFEMGVKYLHNFMYPLALREFEIAKKSDPSFAMSYWGLAMSYQWPLWSYLDKAKGQKVLYDFEDVKNPKMNSLEQELMSAIRLIYEPGEIITNEKKYMQAMAKIHRHFPTNPDVASFYALALMGYVTDSPFDKNNDVYMQKARNVLLPFFKTHPAHPGIIHYYIHAMDIPNSQFPKKGMLTTQNIFQHMQDSSHVLHMPSHLYTELGRWKESAEANKLSIQASNRMCRFLENKNIHLDDPIVMCSSSRSKKIIKWSPKKKYACDADNVYHSAEWLQYSYLQMGQFQKASDIVEQMKNVVDIVGEPMYDYWYYRTKARQNLYTKNWKPLASLSASIMEEEGDVLWAAYSECGMLLSEGLSAIHHHQTQFLPLITQRYEKVFSILDKRKEGGFRDACLITKAEFLAAKKYYIEKNQKSSLDILANSLKIQNKMQASNQSLTLPYIPLQEFYADLLMQTDTSQNLKKAIELYKEDLKYFPNRFQAFLGIAKAEAKLGNRNHAKYWYQKLINQFENGDPNTFIDSANKYLSST